MSSPRPLPRTRTPRPPTGSDTDTRAPTSGVSDLCEEMRRVPVGSGRYRRARDELVSRHEPLAAQLAWRFRGRGEDGQDLYQVAMLGLLKSVDRFDVTRGVEFSSYATPVILGEIRRHFRDTGWAVRVPRRLQELKPVLRRASGELAQCYGRAPTIAELAGHLDITESEVIEGLLSTNAYSAAALDATDSDRDDAPTIADRFGGPDEALEHVENRESVKPMLRRLPARERRILALRYFGDKTQTQIAAELSISQMHVSRLLQQSLTRLRRGLLAESLAEPVRRAPPGPRLAGPATMGRERGAVRRRGCR